MTRRRTVAALAASALVVTPLGWLWQQSLLPSAYSAVDMGYADYGGGPHGRGAGMSGMPGMGGTSVVRLTAPAHRTADVRVNLVAEQHGDRYTFNGTSPGPTIRATQGQLVQVTVRNRNVDQGITVHWHGVDVPNAEDGVAGVTQDAVRPGATFTYRFVAGDAGTYWYHSHQVADEQVARGLFGALIVEPAGVDAPRDDVLIVHSGAAGPTINGHSGITRIRAAPGELRRLRIINTDNGTATVSSDSPYRVRAIDGHDIDGPTWVRHHQLGIAAGGRADTEVAAPAVVHIGSRTVAVGPATTKPPTALAPPQPPLDLMTYGHPPATRPLAGRPDRRFVYSIGRRPGFLDGRPGLWWSVNGHLYPDIPMFMVREGDLVAFHIENHSGQVHPMHLHGHHAVIVAEDGRTATGSPVWVDSIDVENGHSVDLRFRADNPGVWMDHCHNLPHASQGLVAHLMYEGVSTPYRIGGHRHNDPE